MRSWRILLVFCLFLTAVTQVAAQSAPGDGSDEKSFAEGSALYSEKNYAEAYTKLKVWILNPKNRSARIIEAISHAVDCLRQLGRESEQDELLEQIAVVHKDNEIALARVAASYNYLNHYGYIIGGEFSRGDSRAGAGRYVDSAERDRVRALQLQLQALKIAEIRSASSNQHWVSAEYANLAQSLLGYSFNQRGRWKLSHLTDLIRLPDYSEFPEGHHYRSWGEYNGVGAPVDSSGDPLFYHLPENFEAAENDGERWRWALAQATKLVPSYAPIESEQLAQFYLGQYGTETLKEYPWFGEAPRDLDTDKRNTSGTYALHTLSDDETIARLASGIKRFNLPAEFNYITLYKKLAEDDGSQVSKYTIEKSLDTLAEIYENRRQYVTAARYWKTSIDRFGPGDNGEKQKRLDQLVGAWGEFEPASPQTAGGNGDTRPAVAYRFRNGSSVELVARAIDLEKLLKDVKQYLSSQPRKLEYEQMDIQNLGYRLVQNRQEEYLRKTVARWTETLKPRENHFDERVTIHTPLTKPGAYLLTARIAGGTGSSSVVVWVTDTVIVKKPLQGSTLLYVADAATGRPIEGVKLNLFGYRQVYNDQSNPVTKVFRRSWYDVVTSSLSGTTDSSGLASFSQQALSSNYQWLISTDSGGSDADNRRLAYLGFSNIWFGRNYDYEYNQTKVLTITDRPVYRPGQTVKFKLWVREAQYDQEDYSKFADQSFEITVQNPKGDKILQQRFTADAYGGVLGELQLEKEAQLGVYSVSVTGMGWPGTFRVEEYKKPEFEVKVEAPSEPVALGEKISARVEARYYFGAPVTEATVKYKVLRSPTRANWYPAGIWDWFYGRGYWWFAYDYLWYPHWERWGCFRPLPWWWAVPQSPPEVVLENEVPVGSDGTVQIAIDTGPAKELHGDKDHTYSISVDVTDQSRRTISGAGEVIVARQPFKVYAWVDRGHYTAGDIVKSSFSAQTLQNKPVTGTGRLRLYRVSYDNGRKPVEKLVEEWKLDTDSQGKAEQQFKVAASGQHRLSFEVTDKQNRTVEGGYILTVVGEGSSSENYRFNDLELIPDKREYAPGEKVRLMVNTEGSDSTVLLFVRPANGVYLEPELLRLDGKSTIREILVSKKDMPNFFVEAVTVRDGQVYSEMREIVVPPEKRVLNVEVKPSATRYKPGESAKLELKLTELSGKPFEGSAVVSVYDRALEYISGGSNVPEIKEFFWKWRRSHQPHRESNVDRLSEPVTPSWEVAMQAIGLFGDTVVEETGGPDGALRRFAKRMNGSRGGEGAAVGYSLDENRSEAMVAASMGVAAPEAKFEADKDDSGRVDLLTGVKNQAPGKMADRENSAALSGPGELAQPTIRKELADLAFWNGAVTTNSDGIAEVQFKMPENLSEWKVKVWAMGHGTKVGQGETEVVTSKDLLIRMQTPRFFVEKDEVVLSANVHNYLDTPAAVTTRLELAGGTLELMGPAETKIDLPSKGERRVDWRVKVLREGEAVVRMFALSARESDAMEMKLPVQVHGMLKTESFSGAIRPPGNKGGFSFTVPAERRVDNSRLEIRYSPTLAAAMVDALPYLLEFPYGCTEQTLSRFLPAVITQRVLQRMKLNLKEIKDKRTNLNAQEIGDDKKRAKGWKRFDRNPVFDEDELGEIATVGLKRIEAMQLSDGGWGWFSGWGENSSPHTTAYVVHSLQTAKKNGMELSAGALERGIDWLKNYQSAELRKLRNAATKTNPWKNHADELDAFVFMVLTDAGERGSADAAGMLEFLYRVRGELAVYAKTMFALSLFTLEEQGKLAMLRKNIEQHLVQDDENQTAYLKLPESNYWWSWYGSENEAIAYYLRLLTKVDPKGAVAPRLVKYLLNNRKNATYWDSTRDTAIVVESFADFLAASGESEPDLEVELFIDGKKRKEVKINSTNLFTFDNKFVLEGELLTSGGHTVELRKKGRGPLYYNGYLTNFTLEDYITKAGLEVKVERSYYRLVREESSALVQGASGQAISQQVEKYRREPLENLGQLKSGELVEIELEIESKNDYEYLVFEDMKPAGFEPVEVRSGYTKNDLRAYVEFRDNRVAFFVQRLARGKSSVSYRMRAEIPGRFSALPTRAWAMYAPELRGNSDEIKLQVVD